jgi:hypothetical protein
VVRGGMTLTGTPALIMDRWVDEKTRWPASLAFLKRRATRADKFSERPSCIAVVGEVMSGSTREGRGGAEVRQKQPDQLIKSILELQLPFRRRNLQRIMENGNANAHQDCPINHIFMPKHRPINYPTSRRATVQG